MRGAARGVETRERDRRSTPTVGGDDGERAANEGGGKSALALSDDILLAIGTVSARRWGVLRRPDASGGVGFRGAFGIRAADR